MSRLNKSISAFALTVVITAASVLMIGPQIMVIVPVALLAGIVFAVRRSFLSLVCLGYPLTFGLVSAWIGCAEINDYSQTTAFFVSVVIGMIGVCLIATGFWKVLPERT